MIKNDRSATVFHSIIFTVISISSSYAGLDSIKDAANEIINNHLQYVQLRNLEKILFGN